MYCEYRRKKKRSRTGKIIKVFLVFLLLFLFYKAYSFRVLSLIVNYSSGSIYSNCFSCVNACVLSEIKSTDYSDLIYIGKDNGGNVSIISANSLKINELNKTLAVKTEELIKQSVEKGVKLPLGVFFGISFLSGVGEKINYKLLTAESVSCDFYTEFTSVGINQTRHAVYVNVISEVGIYLPLTYKVVKVESKVLIAENVIVGKVPETYLNGRIL